MTSIKPHLSMRKNVGRTSRVIPARHAPLHAMYIYTYPGIRYKRYLHSVQYLQTKQREGPGTHPGEKLHQATVARILIYRAGERSSIDHAAARSHALSLDRIESADARIALPARHVTRASVHAPCAPGGGETFARRIRARSHC
jgi:hypothetical protein